MSRCRRRMTNPFSCLSSSSGGIVMRTRTIVVALITVAYVVLVPGAGAAQGQSDQVSCSAFDPRPAQLVDRMKNGVACLQQCMDGSDPAAPSCQKATHWLEAAQSEDDTGVAKFNLALMYEKGLVRETTEPDKATQLYRAAAEEGLAEAQYNYALRRTAADAQEAARFMRRAAEGGYGPAQYHLGVRYLEGNGVPTSYLQAYIWLQLADRAGEDLAESYRAWLPRALSETDMSIADQYIENIHGRTAPR